VKIQYTANSIIMNKIINIAVILAGGSGKRFGADLPKQFLEINGKTILQYSIEAFEKNQKIHEIIVVSNPQFIKKTTEIIKNSNYSKIVAILEGGNERYESSLNAIKFISKECNLLLHDAVRPFVSQQIIDNVIEALEKYNAVSVAVPVSDTILQSNENQLFIESVPNRNFLFAAQTPQAFKWSVLKKAYEIGLKSENFIATDDASVIKKYLPNEQIFIGKGEQTNIKITYSSDILIAKLLINK